MALAPDGRYEPVKHPTRGGDGWAVQDHDGRILATQGPMPYADAVVLAERLCQHWEIAKHWQVSQANPRPYAEGGTLPRRLHLGVDFGTAKGTYCLVEARTIRDGAELPDALLHALGAESRCGEVTLDRSTLERALRRAGIALLASPDPSEPGR